MYHLTNLELKCHVSHTASLHVTFNTPHHFTLRLTHRITTYNDDSWYLFVYMPSAY